MLRTHFLLLALVLVLALEAQAEIVITQERKKTTQQHPVINDIEVIQVQGDDKTKLSFTLQHVRFSPENLTLIISGYIWNKLHTPVLGPTIIFVGKNASGKRICGRNLTYDNIRAGKRALLDNVSFYCPEGKPARVEYKILHH